MADPQVEQDVQQNQDNVQKKFDSPYDFLATIEGAPDKTAIETMKRSTPNNRIRVFSPDAKRVFLVRGVSGLELSNLQKQLPANVNPDKAESELALLVGATSVMWTNTTTNNKLTAEDLRLGSAGLPATLFQLVSFLSDFVDPEALNALSSEL